MDTMDAQPSGTEVHQRILRHLSMSSSEANAESEAHIQLLRDLAMVRRCRLPVPGINTRV